ncbi:hypothetical protein TI04_05595 [Achromatium sp. WMS2]|nr:hypothetical protein TI04_05595 [Achromatium sp. WMS2]
MDTQAYIEIARVEGRHWWYQGRRRIINTVLSAYLPTYVSQRIAEIGCGAGGNLPVLAQFGNVIGIEPCAMMRQYAIQRSIHTIVAGSLPDNIPFENDSLNVICLFDVLEHIEDDYAALTAIYKILTHNGTLALTVPALPILWSGLDDAAHHKRRYYKGDLRLKVETAGFRIKYITYFNTLLFPAILGVRLMQRLVPTPPDAHFAIPSPWLNSLFLNIFSLEQYLVPRFLLPFGVSIILIAQKVHRT